MKKINYIIGVIILIIGFIFYASEEFLGLDLLNMIIPDTVAPSIDTSGLQSNVQLNGEYSFEQATCTDNYDDTCTVVITNELDTSILGEQTITIKATDQSGNETSVDFVITVYEGINPKLFIPDGYYDTITGLVGEQLVNELNDIITNHTEFPYTDKGNVDVWYIMREADEDPDNPDNVIMFYTGISLPKICQDTTYPPAECNMTIDGLEKTWEWNREHIWSKSRGDFEHEDGSSAYAMGAHTDLHHLVASYSTMNSTKNNRLFEDCNDGDDTNIVDRGYGNYTCNDWEFEPRDDVKGDVARMLFYMAVRYEGEEGDYVDLELANDPDETKSSKLPIYGDLDDLLRWHMEDPVDMKEINRNNVVYSYQNNRNPFIDNPELVELIWGSPEDYN